MFRVRSGCRRFVFILSSFVVVFGLLAFFSGTATALSPSNSGLTGLWEYPTAQMAGDGAGWIGLTDTDPYQYAYVSMGYLPWLEANLRLTRFTTGAVISPGYGRYKDKSMDFKLLLRRQEGLSPSVAVGAMDMIGTELMKAYYSVATYEWEHWAVTMGYGTDRLNGFFGGISWQAAPWLELKAEYSPLDYTGDVAGGNRVHPDPADSKINFGAVATLPGDLRLSVSHQRGERTCLALAYPFDLSKTFAKRPRRGLAKRPESIPVPDWEATDLEELGTNIVSASGRELGMRNVAVFASPEGQRLLVSYENVAFSSHARAMAGLAALVAYKAPWDVETLSLAVCLRGKAVTRVDIPGEQLALLRLNDVVDTDRQGALFFSSGFVTPFGALQGESWNLLAGRGETARNGRDVLSATPAWEPRVDRSLDDDYMDRFSVDLWWRHRYDAGWESFFDVRVPVANNIDPDKLWWEPETNDETRIWKGVLSCWTRFDDDIWVAGEAGWLDSRWFGGNFWARRYSRDGRWWLGVRASLVHERDPQDFAGLADTLIDYSPPNGGIVIGDGEDSKWYPAGWAQIGYYDPEMNLNLQAEAGQFIDSDTGVRLAVNRHWDDLTVGAWISRTERLTQDRNYSNAGLYLEIPAEFWTGRPSDLTWTQEFSLLSTWRIRAARQPGSWMPPEKLWEPLRPARLRHELYGALEELSTLARGELPRKDNGPVGLLQYMKGYRADSFHDE